MKKLICLCLGLAILLTLAAGCQGGKTIGQEVPTTIAVNDDDLNKAAQELGDLDDDALAALRKALEMGVDNIPAEDQPVETMPPTMPAGTQTDAAEARALMKKTLEILGSGKFTLKSRSSSPFAAGGNAATPLTLVMNEDVMAFEVDMDWVNLFKSEGKNATTARIQAASAQTLFGKKMRIITKTDGVTIVFVDTKTCMPIVNPSEDGEEPIGFDLPGAMGEVFGGAKSKEEIEKRLNEFTSSKVTADGKDYICATMNADGNTMRYFFYKGDLKRIEVANGEETVMWEIDSLSSQVDPAFFSTAGMHIMAPDQMVDLGSSLGGLLG